MGFSQAKKEEDAKLNKDKVNNDGENKEEETSKPRSGKLWLKYEVYLVFKAVQE